MNPTMAQHELKKSPAQDPGSERIRSVRAESCTQKRSPVSPFPPCKMADRLSLLQYFPYLFGLFLLRRPSTLFAFCGLRAPDPLALRLSGP